MNVRRYDAGGEVVAAFWTPAGPVAVTGDGRIARPELAGEGLGVATAHDGALLCAEPSPDGSAVLTGGDDGRLVVTGADGVSTVLATVARRWIDHVAVSPASGLIACAAGREVHVLDRQGRPAYVFTLNGSVGGLAFDAKGRRLAVAHYDGVSLFWAADAAGRPKLLEWKGSHIGVTFSPDNRFVVSSMQENALHCWRLADGRDMRMTGYATKVRSLAWAGKGRWLATSGAPRVILWPFQGKDGPMSRPPTEPGEPGAIVTCVAASARGDRIAAGTAGGGVLVVDVGTAMPMVAVRGEGDGVTAIAFSPDGRGLVFGTGGGRIGLAGAAV